MVTTPVEWLDPTAFLGAADDSTLSRMIQLADGRLLAAVSTPDASGAGSPADGDILGRFHDPAGQPLGDWFRLNTRSILADETGGTITALPDGGFCVTYTRLNFTGFPLLPDTNIIVETFNADGTPRNDLLLVGGAPGGTLSGSPQVGALSNTRALVVWSDSNDDIRAQIINPQTGALVAGQFEIFNGATGAGEGLNGITLTALDQSNQYLVAWGDRDTANNSDLQFKLISSSGVVGATVTVQTAAGDIGQPAVTELTDGRFAVAWMRDGGGADDEEVRLRLYNSNGTPATGVLDPQATANGTQWQPAVAATDDGGVVVFWADYPTSSIIGQRYTDTGLKLGTTFTVQNQNATELRNLQAARLEDGRISLTWLEDFASGGDLDSRFAIWDPRDTTNAPDDNGIVAGTRNNDVIAVVAGTEQVFAGKGADSIELDLADIAGLTTLDGGAGNDEIRINAQAGTFDLRPVWVAYNEEVEFAGGANLARTVQLEALDVAFLSEIDFDASAGSAEKVLISMGSQSRLDFSNLVMTDQQAGLDSLVIKGDGTVETITGSAGSDTVEGFGGNDTLAGKGGNDTVEGGAGADSLTGGNGQDTVSYAGDTQAVTVSLGTQTASGPGFASGDTIAGFEHANGGSGNDALFGSTAANTLKGNGGDDVLHGAGGADSIDGGAGNDTFWIDDGDIVAGDILYGGGGAGTNDRLHLIANGGGAGLTTTDLRPAAIAGMERITFANTTGDSVVRINRYQMDTVTVIEGFAGLGIDETLEVFSAVDTVVNLSALTFTGWDAALNLVKLTGDGDNEVLTGTGQRDSIGGGDGNDTLSGGAGNDTLSGSLGNDTLFGGAGADSLQGGADTDTVDYSAQPNAATGLTINLQTGTASGQDATGDTLGGIENVIGSAAGDTITGADGTDNLLYGGAGGNDTLSGGSGNDSLFGGSGTDSLDGGDGTDIADYTASIAGVTVRLWNGTGVGGDAEGDSLTAIENLRGSSVTDSLIGDDLVGNILEGQGGNDYLNGLNGDDSLYGGSENDILDGDAGADLLDGGDGTGDWADYSAAATGVIVRLWNGTGQNGDAQGDVLVAVENLRGGLAADTLLGADAQGNSLEGREGNDYLNGLSGNDALFGGTENDILDGAGGNDTLDGGAGADDFVFGTGSGADTVTLFEDGSDQVDLTGALVFGDLSFAAIAGGVRVEITATPADRIDLIGVTLGQITAGDFI